MLEFSSIMEMLMVICFGFSWPFNISKMWRARSTKGTSLAFYFLIWSGYIFAIIGKLVLIHYRVSVEMSAGSWTEVVKWYVMFFYGLNFLMLTAGILIWFRNRSLDRRREAGEKV